MRGAARCCPRRGRGGGWGGRTPAPSPLPGLQQPPAIDRNGAEKGEGKLSGELGEEAPRRRGAGRVEGSAQGSRGAGRAGRGVRAGSGPARLAAAAAAAAEPRLRFRQPLRDCRREESEEPPPGSSLPSAESGAATGRGRLPGPSPGGKWGRPRGPGSFSCGLKGGMRGGMYTQPPVAWASGFIGSVSLADKPSLSLLTRV